MSAMAYQITGVSTVYSTVCSGADQRKYQSSAALVFVGGNSPVTGEFAVQRDSKAENISFWWFYQVYIEKNDTVVTVWEAWWHIYVIQLMVTNWQPDFNE